MNYLIIYYMYYVLGIKHHPQHTDSHPCTRPPSWGTRMGAEAAPLRGEARGQPPFLGVFKCVETHKSQCVQIRWFQHIV